MNSRLSFKKKTKNPVLSGGVLSFMHPLREWLGGLTIASVVLVSGGVYIAYDFYAQFYASEKTITIEGQAVMYQETEVIEYAELYNARDVVFQGLRAERRFIPTPVVTEEVDDITFDLPLVNQ